jgi:hypothetical protein
VGRFLAFYLSVGFKHRLLDAGAAAQSDTAAAGILVVSMLDTTIDLTSAYQVPEGADGIANAMRQQGRMHRSTCLVSFKANHACRPKPREPTARAARVGSG